MSLGRSDLTQRFETTLNMSPIFHWQYQLMTVVGRHGEEILL
jgi:hypothetical protein